MGKYSSAGLTRPEGPPSYAPDDHETFQTASHHTLDDFAVGLDVPLRIAADYARLEAARAAQLGGSFTESRAIMAGAMANTLEAIAETVKGQNSRFEADLRLQPLGAVINSSPFSRIQNGRELFAQAGRISAFQASRLSLLPNSRTSDEQARFILERIQATINSDEFTPILEHPEKPVSISILLTPRQLQDPNQIDLDLSPFGNESF